MPREPMFVLEDSKPLAGNVLSVVAPRGIFRSTIATGVLGFVTSILFLFCTPDFKTLFALDAPQPFVQMYLLAFGRGGALFMSILAIVELTLVRRNLLNGLGCKLTAMTEHQSHFPCSHTPGIRCGSRRRASWVKMDQSSRKKWST